MYNFENKERASRAGKKSRRGKSDEVKDLRKVIYNLVVKKQKKIEAWLDEVAKNDPEKALKLYISLLGYVLPRLQSVDPPVLEEVDKDDDDKYLDLLIKDSGIDPDSFK